MSQEILINTGRKLNLNGFSNVADVLPVGNPKVDYITKILKPNVQKAQSDDIQKGQMEYAFDGYGNEKVTFNKTGEEIATALTAQVTKLEAKAILAKIKMEEVGKALKEEGYEPTQETSPFNYLTEDDCCPTFDVYGYRKDNNLDWDKPDDTCKQMQLYNDCCYKYHNIKSDVNFTATLVRNLEKKKKYVLNAKQLAILGF